MRKINFITLGCSKNVVDSEHLMAQAQRAGYEVVFDSDTLDAEVVIINTCGFIGDAKEESINLILEAAQAKEEGMIDELYVVGCLSERYADLLRCEIPEVDRYFGVNDWRQIIEQLGGEHIAQLETSRITTTPQHYAYLKISEGCNWKCGYCAIPFIRGKHISVPIETLLEEATKLAAQGVKELIVIAQDTTYYGVDLYGRRVLHELLHELCLIEGIEWIRLHYAYPTAFPDEVIEVMAREDKICKYLDIPFQHISDSQLSAMKRRHTKAEAEALIDKLRTRIPNIALRTTLLVGYPTESEKDFEELKEFVSHNRFERLGVFQYSPEEGTFSATKMQDDVTPECKEARQDQIMLLQNQISLENNTLRQGQKLKVIVDKLEGEYYVARSQYDSPEVDCEILIPTNTTQQLTPGNFYTVEITNVEEYDLFGVIR